MLAVEASGRKRLRTAIRAIVAHHTNRHGNADPIVVAMTIGNDIATAAAPIIEDVRASGRKAGAERILSELRTVDAALKDWEDSHTWDDQPRKHRTIVPMILAGTISGSAATNYSASHRKSFKTSGELAKNIGDVFVMRAARGLRKRDEQTAKEAAKAVATTEGLPALEGPYRAPGNAGIYADAEQSAIVRADTVAATEASAEFNVVRDAISSSVDFGANILIEKEWSAVLDKAVCPICLGLHGQRIPITQQSWHGFYTGDVHPRCRCQWFYVWGFENFKKAA